MFRCKHHLQGAHYLSLLKQGEIERSLKMVFTPKYVGALKQAQIVRSLKMVFTPKHVGAF